MKLFFKIIGSFVLALLIIIMLLLVIVMIDGSAPLTDDWYDALAGLWVFAAIGFIMFSIPGALCWAIVYEMLHKSKLTEAKKHLLSAYSSALICGSIIGYQMFSGQGGELLQKMAMILAIVFSVATVSLLLHIYLYHRKLV